MPADNNGVHRKVAAAIHNNNINEAFKLITNSPSRDSLVYELSYCHYRLNRFDQCLECLAPLEEDCKVLDLKAQAYFRQKRYQEAYDTYMSLIERGFGEENIQERNSNLAAIVVSAQLEAPDTLKTNPKCFEKLPSVEEIIESIDILSLEDENWFVGTKYVKKALAGKRGMRQRQTVFTRVIGTSRTAQNKQQKQSTEPTEDTENRPVKSRKQCKHRKKRLPKHLDPAGPDPERWLPKWQRSSYNARRKDRQQRKQGGVAGETAAIRGTQGAVSEADAVPLAKSNKPAAPVAGASQGPRQMRPVAQKKKKKVGRR